MKILLLTVVAFVLLLHGEQKSTKPASDQEQVQGVKEPSQHIVVVEQEHSGNQGDASKNHSESYLHELLLANNLPNLLLFFAGLGGIAVGVCTLRDIRMQTGLLGQYVDATRVIAIATLRPKLVIRGIALIPGEYIEVAGEQREVEKGNSWRLECLIANSGGSVAHVTQSNLTTGVIEQMDGKLPVFPPYSDGLDWLGTADISPGEHKLIQTPLTTNNAYKFRFIEVAREAGSLGYSNMYCFGFIQYRDDAGVERRTAFCLQQSIQTRRFDRINDPNYEYAD